GDLVVEAALLGGEAVEFALAAAERLLGIDEIGGAARVLDQRAQAVDGGPQGPDAGVEILPLHGDVVAVGAHPGDRAGVAVAVDGGVVAVGGDPQGQGGRWVVVVGARLFGAAVDPAVQSTHLLGRPARGGDRVVGGDVDAAGDDLFAFGAVGGGAVGRGRRLLAQAGGDGGGGGAHVGPGGRAATAAAVAAAGDEDDRPEQGRTQDRELAHDRSVAVAAAGPGRAGRTSRPPSSATGCSSARAFDRPHPDARRLLVTQQPPPQ